MVKSLHIMSAPLPPSPDPHATHDLTDQTQAHNDTHIPHLKEFGHFRDLEFVGAGGMGAVYKAYDSILQRYVALKFVTAEVAEMNERFLMEARAQAKIDHPHVCKIFEAGSIEGKLYIAMQLIQGRTLKDTLPSLTLEEKTHVFRKVADGVHAAHRAGLIHRDLKPANIMLEQGEDGVWHPYVMDFGLARLQQEPGLTMSGAILGSPWYMSPEQARGEIHRMDRRTDVYSLGATFYEVFSGKLPFPGESGVEVLMKLLSSSEPEPLRAAEPSIPADIETIILKCLEKVPERRYESARALAEDLTRFLEGEAIRARPASLGYKIQKRIKKHKAIVFTSAIAVLVIVFVSAMALHTRNIARLQAAAAQEFGQQVKEMETILGYAHLVPLHDLRPEKAKVREQIALLESEIRRLGPFAQGPGNYALGRGHIALREYETARRYLDLAWASGYRKPDVAYALGLAYGNLYKLEQEEARRLSDAKAREEANGRLVQELRNPALNYLKLGSAVATDSVDYVRALIAYYERDWKTALQHIVIARLKLPWAYEITCLEGDIHTEMGIDYQVDSKTALALAEFEKARALYATAKEVGRSDERIYLGLCLLWNRILITVNDKGEDPTEALNSGIDACNMAVKADADNAEILDEFARIHMRQADHLFYTGQECAPAYRKSIDLAQRALKVKPDWNSPIKKIGYSYLGLADDAANRGSPYKALFDQAIAYYRRANELDRTDFVPLNNLGYAYSRLAELADKEGANPWEFAEEAIRFYSQVVRSTPTVNNNLGTCYQQMGEYLLEHGGDPRPLLAKALAAYEKGLESSPGYELALINSAKLHALLGVYLLAHGQDPGEEIRKSSEFLNHAAMQAPGRDHPYETMAENLMVLAEHESRAGKSPSATIAEGRRNAEKAVSINSASAQNLKTLAATYVSGGAHLLRQGKDPTVELARARKFARRAFQQDPSFLATIVQLAEIEYLQGVWQIKQRTLSPDLDDAVRKLELAAGTIPPNADVSEMLGRLYALKAEWLLKNHRDASAELRKGMEYARTALQTHPGMALGLLLDARLHCLLANSPAEKGRKKEWLKRSADSYEKACSVNPLLSSEIPGLPCL